MGWYPCEWVKITRNLDDGRTFTVEYKDSIEGLKQRNFTNVHDAIAFAKERMLELSM